jgi:hypothetical protein
LTNDKLQFWFSALVIILIAASRLMPHTDNFVPVFAMILFASVHLKNKLQAILISIGALWLSDLYINNWGKYAEYHNDFVLFSSPFNYLSYLLIALIGVKLFQSTISIKKVFGSSLFIGVVFFIVSNFGVWFSGFMYPLTFDGLLSCYIAAIPFFRATLASNILFSFILFGGYYALQKEVKSLQLEHVKYSKF